VTRSSTILDAGPAASTQGQMVMAGNFYGSSGPDRIFRLARHEFLAALRTTKAVGVDVFALRRRDLLMTAGALCIERGSDCFDVVGAMA